VSGGDEHRYAVWTAEWAGDMATDVRGRGHAIRVDEPPEYGGEDSGPMPTELLTAALASCFCVSMAWAARKRRVELPSVRVHVRAERAPGEPRHGAYDLWVEAPLDPEPLQRLVDLASRWCWVTNTLTTPPEIRYHLGEPTG
jgi:putative redox protein